jgi:hypothetical protein
MSSENEKMQWKLDRDSSLFSVIYVDTVEKLRALGAWTSHEEDR